ncbi:MAG: aminopeptidase, partial [Telluria sp.]
MRRLPFSVAALCLSLTAFAAEPFDDKFRQLEEVLPTPNTIRNAAGAPGHAYWQQRADYSIRARLDEANRSISATETITYHNNSPDSLSYLWIQLDQNIFEPGSDARTTSTVASREAWGKARNDEEGMKFEGMRSILEARTFEGGFKIGGVKTTTGQPLKYTINKTMMRIDLPQPMKPGSRFAFNIDFSYKINE